MRHYKNVADALFCVDSQYTDISVRDAWFTIIVDIRFNMTPQCESPRSRIIDGGFRMSVELEELRQLKVLLKGTRLYHSININVLEISSQSKAEMLHKLLSSIRDSVINT